MNARSRPYRHVRAAVLLATASALALLAGLSRAEAEDCRTEAAPPADLATPSMLYEALRTRTNAQLLAMGFLRKQTDNACAWIYEVKVLTASGSVVELDFAADNLDLVGARGPDNDRDAAALVKNFGGDSRVLAPDTADTDKDAKTAGSGGSGKGSGGDDGEGGEGSGEGGEGGGEGGEGGNSGSGSDNSGPGGGGEGGGESGGEGGGEGGNSGSGGGEGGGGEGGDD
jgi:hypothetical protein